MVHTYPGTFDEYVAYCRRNIERQRQRDEQAAKPPLTIEETWQLTMFDEPAQLVREVIVDTETA